VSNFPPILPNRRSPAATPASLLIDLRYAKLGIIARWSWDRYIRLAAFLNYTPAELASVVALPHRKLKAIEAGTMRFPGSTALVLTLLEAQAMRNYSTDIIPQPFPTNDSPKSP